MKCRHCGTPDAELSWTVDPCSLQPKTIRARLCEACDVEVNDYILQFFNVRGRRKLMEAYRDTF